MSPKTGICLLIDTTKDLVTNVWDPGKYDEPVSAYRVLALVLITRRPDWDESRQFCRNIYTQTSAYNIRVGGLASTRTDLTSLKLTSWNYAADVNYRLVTARTLLERLGASEQSPNRLSVYQKVRHMGAHILIIVSAARGSERITVGFRCEPVATCGPFLKPKIKAGSIRGWSPYSLVEFASSSLRITIGSVGLHWYLSEIPYPTALIC